MSHLSSRTAVWVWVFLVLATLASAWLAEHHGLAGRWTVAVIMLVAAFKARAVIMYFMELKSAPAVWRRLFEAWLWISVLQIVAFWAWGVSIS